jgi:hypothetical protein
MKGNNTMETVQSPGLKALAEEDIENKKAEKKKPMPRTWRPARMLDIPEKFKDPRFVYRHCTTNKPGNIQKKLAEGWEVDKEILKKMEKEGLIPKTIQDGEQQDGVMRIREMVVMRMPKELAQSRREYYNSKTDSREKKIDDDLRSSAPIYGKIQRG